VESTIACAPRRTSQATSRNKTVWVGVTMNMDGRYKDKHIPISGRTAIIIVVSMIRGCPWFEPGSMGMVSRKRIRTRLTGHVRSHDGRRIASHGRRSGGHGRRLSISSYTYRERATLTSAGRGSTVRITRVVRPGLVWAVCSTIHEVPDKLGLMRVNRRAHHHIHLRSRLREEGVRPS
jgi:hypothetical protein